MELEKIRADQCIPEEYVYPTPDVNQYIAELEEKHKMEIEQLLLEIVQTKRAAQTLRKKMNHWKRKWCLKAASFCMKEGIEFEGAARCGLTDDIRKSGRRWAFRKSAWARILVELAEKFKEAK